MIPEATGLREWIVSKKLKDLWDIDRLRLTVIPFPFIDGSVANTDHVTYLPLLEPVLHPRSAQVVAEGVELFRKLLPEADLGGD